MLRQHAMTDPGERRKRYEPEERADHAHHQKKREVVPAGAHEGKAYARTMTEAIFGFTPLELVLLGIAALLLSSSVGF